MKVKPEATELLEENISDICDKLLSLCFFGLDTKSKGNKSENKQITLCQTKKLHSNTNHQQKEKATYWIRNNAANHISDKRLISNIQLTFEQ